MSKLILVGFLLVVIAVTLVCIIGIRPKKKLPSPEPIVEDQEGMQSKQLDVEDAKVDYISKNRTTVTPEELNEAEKIRIATEKQIQQEREALAFNQYHNNHKLRYCGALYEDFIPRSLNEIYAILKSLEEKTDLQASDFYNYSNHFVAIWNGEKWLLGHLHHLITDDHAKGKEEIHLLPSEIKYSPELLALKERLLSANLHAAFDKIIDDGNKLFPDSDYVDAEYPLNRWKWLRDKSINFRNKEIQDYVDNIALATNKQVYDIALSVADESSDSGFVSFIRREFSDRLKILKELDLARQYQMDQQEQAKQELDSAARFFN